MLHCVHPNIYIHLSDLFILYRSFSPFFTNILSKRVQNHRYFTVTRLLRQDSLDRALEPAAGRSLARAAWMQWKPQQHVVQMDRNMWFFGCFLDFDTKTHSQQNSRKKKQQQLLLPFWTEWHDFCDNNSRFGSGTTRTTRPWIWFLGSRNCFTPQIMIVVWIVWSLYDWFEHFTLNLVI